MEQEGPLASVLVVEDEAKISAAVRRGLEAEGFRVEVAANGNDGYDLAKSGRFDVVVLDILLPGMSGFLVCGELRAIGVHTPILMLTAKDGEYDLAEALETGADDYVTKPFSFVVLVARIRALLRRCGHSDDTAAIRAGDLMVDVRSRRCHRGDTRIELTSREFAVLTFLMSRADAAVSKTEILENVWDLAFDGDANIVEVYVGHLRRKVDEPFGRNAIETVRGIGYRLDKNGG